MFILAYRYHHCANRVTADSHGRYFLPRVKIESYNSENDGRNLYDQPINDLTKQYDEVRKVSPGQGNDYITGSLLDFVYFKKKIQTNWGWFKKLKITVLKLMEEIFMISQLMTWLSNMIRSEKYHQDKAMITKLVFYWILLISKNK